MNPLSHKHGLDALTEVCQKQDFIVAYAPSDDMNPILVKLDQHKPAKNHFLSIKDAPKPHDKVVSTSVLPSLTFEQQAKILRQHELT
jgi:hypothetical protein